MSKPELTKQFIAGTLKELMLNTPLDKISVQDIVRACGLNRKTFYYHFKDKQALVCWIFDNEVGKLTDLDQNNTIIDELIEHLYANKSFYVAALTSDVQNNLREHLFKITYDANLSIILTILGTRKMAPEDMKIIANYFSHAVVGCITQWAKEGMKASPFEYSIDFHP
ncbi:MAG TPA: TetR family transcriptional regulator, partial [Firmicutes bacterium]|nr:TetR family transcriptional regulator [Bacillota bacterium]